MCWNGPLMPTMVADRVLLEKDRCCNKYFRLVKERMGV